MVTKHVYRQYHCLGRGLRSVRRKCDGNTLSGTGDTSWTAMTAEDHRNRTLATLAILNEDNARLLALDNELSNAYLKGTDDYPLDLTAVLSMLVRYRPSNSTRTAATVPVSNRSNPSAATTSPEAMAGTFVQSAVICGTDGRVFAHSITCNKCKSKRHYANCAVPRPPPPQSHRRWSGCLVTA